MTSKTKNNASIQSLLLKMLIVDKQIVVASSLFNDKAIQDDLEDIYKIEYRLYNFRHKSFDALTR
jgi:hypothetical protein